MTKYYMGRKALALWCDINLKILKNIHNHLKNHIIPGLKSLGRWSALIYPLASIPSHVFLVLLFLGASGERARSHPISLPLMSLEVAMCWYDILPIPKISMVTPLQFSPFATPDSQRWEVFCYSDRLGSLIPVLVKLGMYTNCLHLSSLSSNTMW